MNRTYPVLPGHVTVLQQGKTADDYHRNRLHFPDNQSWETLIQQERWIIVESYTHGNVKKFSLVLDLNRFSI